MYCICIYYISERFMEWVPFLFCYDFSVSKSWGWLQTYRCLFAPKEVNNLVLSICLKSRVFTLFIFTLFIRIHFTSHLFLYLCFIHSSFSCLLTLPSVLFALLLINDMLKTNLCWILDLLSFLQWSSIHELSHYYAASIKKTFSI